MKERSIHTLPLDGGVLCLDFINTVYAWRGPNLHEYLGSYNDVVLWCQKVNALDENDLKTLSEMARQHPVNAEKALTKMKEERKLLYHFFSAVASHSDPVSGAVLSKFNKGVQAAMARLSFTFKNNQPELELSNTKPDLLKPVWVVYKSAYDLLTSKNMDRVKECGVCGWIFLDKTKNNKRQWCNPVSCGSVEKSRKYYQKKKNTKK